MSERPTVRDAVPVDTQLVGGGSKVRELEAEIERLRRENRRLRRQVILLEVTFVPAPQRTENWREFE